MILEAATAAGWVVLELDEYDIGNGQVQLQGKLLAGMIPQKLGREFLAEGNGFRARIVLMDDGKAFSNGGYTFDYRKRPKAD